MNEGQDKWEKLVNLTEEYDPDPDLANEVINKINQRESTVKFRKPIKWIALASCFIICVVFLSIFLPVYLSKPDIGNIYFSDNSIVYEEINDIDSFVRDNKLNIQYFTDESALSQQALLEENNELLFITQKVIYFSGTSLDIINLKVVLLQNAEFDFCKDFDPLLLSLTISSIDIKYSINNDSAQVIYRAKFNYEKVTYYLEINTSDDETDKIKEYIDLLIN